MTTLELLVESIRTYGGSITCKGDEKDMIIVLGDLTYDAQYSGLEDAVNSVLTWKINRRTT